MWHMLCVHSMKKYGMSSFFQLLFSILKPFIIMIHKIISTRYVIPFYHFSTATFIFFWKE